jgi:hypothetical protein
MMRWFRPFGSSFGGVSRIPSATVRIEIDGGAVGGDIA